MPCFHDYRHQVVNGEVRWTCQSCGHISPVKPMPSYEDVLKENERLHQKVSELENTIRDLKDKLQFFCTLDNFED